MSNIILDDLYRLSVNRPDKLEWDLFWAHICPPSNWIDCWIWRKSKRNGFTPFDDRTYAFRRAKLVHRIAFIWVYGEPGGPKWPDRKSQVIDHLWCSYKSCLNPLHLINCTIRQNIEREFPTGTKTQCPYGHPYSIENTRMDRGHKTCKICNSAKRKRWRQRNKAFVNMRNKEAQQRRKLRESEQAVFIQIANPYGAIK